MVVGISANEEYQECHNRMRKQMDIKNVNMVVAHGGGPTSVINSSLRGVIEEAARNGIRSIYGARFGIEGVLADDYYNLSDADPQSLNIMSATPASVIGSCRRKLSTDDVDVVLEKFIGNNVRYFFYNGGNDSMDTCHKIAKRAAEKQYDIRVVGIPKTIDNDLNGTDHCPGYGSAARYVAISAGELMCDVRSLPIHISILEVMGRNAGWLTAAASLAMNSQDMLLYLPEVVFDKNKFIKDVSCRYIKGEPLIIVASEGLRYADGRFIGDTGIIDGFGHTVPGGVADVLAQMITSELSFKVRTEKPGLLGRTSIAMRSSVDVAEAYEAGACAVRYAMEGGTGKMISLVRSNDLAYRCDFGTVPLEQAAGVEKKFPSEWISSSGTAVTDEFAEYCRPLIGDPLDEYLVLR